MNEKLYFKHDLYALEDRPLRKLISKNKEAGYAVFFVALEFLYKDDGNEIDINDLAYDISDKLHMEEGLVKKILIDCVQVEMFELNDNKIFSKRVIAAVKEIQEFSEKQRMNGLKGGAPKGNNNAKKQPKNNPVVEQNNPMVDLKQPKTTLKEDKEEDKDINKEKDICTSTYIQKESTQDVHTLISELQNFWNENCTSCPKALKLTVVDEMNLRTILSDPQITPEIIQEQIKRIQKSDFATGNSEKGWKMTFSKFLSDFTGVINGKYDGTRGFGKPGPRDLGGNHRDAKVHYVEEF